MSSWDIRELRITASELRLSASSANELSLPQKAKRWKNTADFLEQKCIEMERAMGITDKQAAS